MSNKSKIVPENIPISQYLIKLYAQVSTSMKQASKCDSHSIITEVA